MKNDVVVRIKYAQRMGVRCVSVGMIGVMGIVTICLKEIWKLMLAGLPVVLFLALLLWYFESWQIVFFKDGICKRVFFRKRSYQYTQISDAVRGHSVSDLEFVRVVFKDGKAFRFRLQDDNAEKALKMLCKQRTVRWLEY